MARTAHLLALALLVGCNPDPDDKGGKTDPGCQDPEVWYADEDGDGVGDLAAATAACAAPVGHVATGGDCDDNDALVFPGSAESCNGVDDDCNGVVDDNPGDALQLFEDADGDGYGDRSSTRWACEPEAGWVFDDQDCDDSTIDINPEGEDVCGSVDGDCDGVIDACVWGGVLSPADAQDAFVGGTAYASLGEQIVMVGDLDGDGLDDALVSAHDQTGSAGVRAGGATVLGGGPDRSLVEKGSWTGSSAGDRLGFAIAAAGDVAGDGGASVLLSAPRAAVDGEVEVGRVYLLDGSSSGDVDSAASAVFEGGVAWGLLGTGLASAGDVDGDGRDDLLIGAAFFDSSRENQGAVWLVAGRSGGHTGTYDISSYPRWVGEGDNDLLGGRGSLASGDFNGDGFIDIVMGARGRDQRAGVDFAGAVYVIEGRGSGFSGDQSILDADTTFLAVVNRDRTGFGSAVANAQDTDGDGLDDLVVGGPDFDTDAGAVSERGAAWIFLGDGSGWANAAADDAAEIRIEGDGLWDWFGNSVAGVGDADGDGRSEVLIGAFGRDVPADDGLRVTAGVAYVVGGGMASGSYVASELAMRVDGDGADGRLGQGLAGGDLDGDGLSDLLITAPGREDNLGTVLLFSGQPVLDAMAVGR